MKTVFLYILPAILFIVPQNTKAQSFAINTDGSTANTSALLDVKSSAKGILIPRMSKTEKNSIITPATGLLIFQNAPDSIGFYYYNGSSWLWIPNVIQQDSVAWKTTGNAGTNVTSRFIGTTDNIPLSFRQNNEWLGRWNSSSGNYFIGDSAGVFISSGIQNVGIGSGVLQNSTTAYGNVAVGNHAMEKNTSGRRNTAIGDSALFEQSYSTGLSDNTAIGNSTLRFNNPTSNSNGIKNVAVGNDALYANTTGYENVVVGVSAARENLTGAGNTVVGRSANRLASRGDLNSYVGYVTGYSDSTGSANVGMGGYTLQFHQTGNNNTALGAYAMQNDSSGSRNTAVGSFASRENDTARLNTAVGYASLSNNKRSYITAVGSYAGMHNGYTATGNNEGIENTIVGYAAMTGNTLGSQNTVVGYRAMAITEPTFYVANITPSRNVAIGDSALRRNLGDDNVGVGFRSLGASLSNASANANTAIGSNTMFNNVSGTGNVAAGYQALYQSNASNYNVAVGNAALINHKRSGDTYNTAVGSSALEQDSIGFQNTGIGTSSFRFNKEGFYNCGLGINSGYYQKGSNNTFAGAYAGFGERINAANLVLNTGSNNAGLGGGALYSLANGNFNVAIGEDALFSDSSGNYNVAVGNDALRTVTSGSYNVGIGFNTNVSSGTLTNATTVGANAYSTQSNTLILGSINGVNGATTSVNVGIGVSGPDVRLEVNGAIATTPQSLNLTGVATTATITVGNFSFLKVDNTTVTDKTITLSNGLADGQRLTILVRNAGTGTVNFIDNPGTNNTDIGIVGAFNMGDDDTISFIWDSTAGYWVETGRSDN